MIQRAAKALATARGGCVGEPLKRSVIGHPFPMNDFFSLPAERSEFSDAIYGAIGRALTLATQFESNCRALAMLLSFKNEVAKNQNFSLSSQEEMDWLVSKLQKKRTIRAPRIDYPRFSQ